MPWLWIFLGLVILIVVLIVIIVGLPPAPVTFGTYYPSCSRVPDLPQIQPAELDSQEPRFEPCRTLDGNPDPQRFYDTLNDWTILPLDPQIAPSAQQICIEYCPQTQLSPYGCLSEDQQYLDCISKLYPEGCSDPAVPVARNGSLEYYVIGRGKVSCYP